MDFRGFSPSQGRLLGIRWATLLGGGLDSNERRVLRPLPQIHPRGAMGDQGEAVALKAFWGKRGSDISDI